MERKIENPKVFISYAWGTDEYQEKVLAFAARLKADGVEVVLDKWEMDVGNDTYAFMEKSVNDKSIHFVLILLDEVYAQKANGRKGGVGTETQIISPEVYNNIEQTKFVPVVFERGVDGAIFKPTYLKTIFHFDLTGEAREKDYKRLVRHIYGVKTYPVPKKGNKPDWVDKPEIIAVDFYAPLSRLDAEKTTKERRKIANTVFSELVDKVMEINVPNVWESNGQISNPQPFLDAIEATKQYRDVLIELTEKIAGDDYFEDEFAIFAENYKNTTDKTNSPNVFAANHVVSVRSFFLHEIAIYTIAILWKQSEFEKIRNLIQRTYFTCGLRGNKTEPFRTFFYSEDRSNSIRSAKNTKDNKDYISAMTELWKERINDRYSIDQFSFADTLIFNLDVLFSDKDDDWHWFPRAYYLDGEFGASPSFWRFSHGLVSQNEIKRLSPLLGTGDVPALKKLLEKVLNLKNSPAGYRYRYHTIFHGAPVITDCIKIEEIGSMK